jgi:hypothetical protein
LSAIVSLSIIDEGRADLTPDRESATSRWGNPLATPSA